MDAPRTPREFYALTRAFLRAARTRDARVLGEIAAIASRGASAAAAGLGEAQPRRRPLDARLRQPADIQPIRALEQPAPGGPTPAPPPMPPVGPFAPPYPPGIPEFPYPEWDIGPYEPPPFGPIRFADPPYPPGPGPAPPGLPRVHGQEDIRAGGGVTFIPNLPGLGVGADFALDGLSNGTQLPIEGALPPADIWLDTFANGFVEVCYSARRGTIIDDYASGPNPDRSRITAAPAGFTPRAYILKEAGGVDVKVDAVLWSGLPSPFCRAQVNVAGLDGYAAMDDGTGTVLELYRYDNGAPTLLNSAPAAINQGDTISVRAVGPIIDAMLNGAVICSAVDATYPTQTLAGWASSFVGDSISSLAHNPAP